MARAYDIQSGARARELVSQADSATIQKGKTPRSKFINSWTRKTAFDAGLLIPILVDEILPGDHMTYDVTAYIRMSTPLFPLFDNMRVDTHFFFVPNRLVWDNWVRLMGEQDNPASSIAFTTPVVTGTVGGELVGSLADHFGIPVTGQIQAGQQISVNALPFRMYYLIYNQWFRDENMINSQPVAKTDGPDSMATYAIAPRASSHDYFTSCLPWPQKFTAPTISLGSTAPVIGIGTTSQNYPAAPGPPVYETSGGTTWSFAQNANAGTVYIKGSAATSGLPLIYANLAAATGISINTLRQAWLIQELLERDARGGTRYTEKIRNHFDVINPDFRLQRPEYIGGGQSSLNVTPIAQTAPTTAPAGVVGALGGTGTAAGMHHASYAATEHGFIIGLVSVRAELSYQQGLHLQWTRSTMYDYYFPALAGLGEQTVLEREIYCTGNPANDALVFGYQERWQEYRTRTSEVTGIMRSTAASTLDAWHLARKFTSAPNLNATFINETPPMTRVLAAGAASNGQQFLADFHYVRTAVRPIPTYGTPIQLGRF